jgi:hypothetical protein
MVRQLAREYVTNFVNNIRNPHIQATIEENFADDSETIPFALRTMQNRLAIAHSWNNFMKNRYPDLEGDEWADTKEQPLS